MVSDWGAIVTALLRGCVAASRAFQRTWGTVHPHARGEQVCISCISCWRVGSSPRTWGTVVVAQFVAVSQRFIPTHVGNSASPAPWQSGIHGSSPRTWGTGLTHAPSAPYRSVHPHARGEQQVSGIGGSLVAGSSPRTWGTEDAGKAVGKPGRFIPTHVGNSGRERRRCGAICGSSPRTWGTARWRLTDLNRLRFIPTHVGNRLPQPDAACAGAVHPHARGEQRKVQIPACCRARFIPTHVGNRKRVQQWWVEAAVHPHARGEQFAVSHCASSIAGSSPRTWGTDAVAYHAHLRRRFIPTHVGNRLRPEGINHSQTVHPHARGEQDMASVSEWDWLGSSPRTWGTERRVFTGRPVRRFIPTHVGNRHSLRPAPSDRPVHPHARGEQSGGVLLVRSRSGSSPRTWGTVAASRSCWLLLPVHPHARGEQGANRRWPQPPLRFIPTHVGNSHRLIRV